MNAFLFIALCVAFVSAGPVLVQQFTANVSGTAPGFPQQLRGGIWFDYVNHGARVEFPGLLTAVVTPDASTQTSSVYALLPSVSPDCNTVGPFPWAMFPPFTLPPQCVSQGSALVNGVTCSVFACNNVIAQLPSLSLYLNVNDNSFVRVNGTTVVPNSGPVQFLVDFSNTVLGPVNPAYFAKPTGC